MLPRAEMVAIKNSPHKLLLTLATAACLAFAGCTPPGPRALLKGDELLRAGKWEPAIAELKTATNLLPAEPRAWNLLGLAYHRAGQAQPAMQAYRQALLRDRSNLVAVAHFNLGSLLLEQSSPVAAVDALRSYTLLTNSAPGLARLGSAQIRLRQFSDAEKSFVNALRWDAKNAEALNGLGVIRALRGQRDAAQYFTAALQTDPRHAPALLNAGVVAQQATSTKTNALRYYRDYLTAQPNGPYAETVKQMVLQMEAVVRQFETETSATTSPLPKTNAPAVTAPKTNPPAVTPVVAAPPVVVQKTNAPAPAAPVVAKTNPVAAPVAVVTNKPAPPVTVVAVSEPPKVTPAEPITRPPAVTPAPAPKPVAQLPAQPVRVTEVPPPGGPEFATPPASEEKKRGFFSKLNPFGGKPKPAPSNDVSRLIILNPGVEPTVPEMTTRAAERPVFPRYRYLAPAPPAAGNRAAADRALQQGLAAQRAGQAREASAAMTAAVAADPGYFEAQYNAALLAFQSGDYSRALAGWENALALQPDSITTRYNFALTLKQAGHATDAANELEKILTAKPDDARAQLALGNLYAQQLQEPAQARVHYRKFLELDPRSPQATAVRQWLVVNP